MRLRNLAVVITVAGVAALTAASQSLAATAPPTVKTVVRPVTATGHARAGFTVKDEPSGLVDCSTPDPSPGALSRNIEWCSPSYEYAVACWKSATPQHVLCMRNAAVRQLVKIPRSGAFASTSRAPWLERGPLVLVLTDGAHCSIRNGGTAAVLQQHPTWNATYYCTSNGAVWAPPGAAHQGVDEATPTWTVRTAPVSGYGNVVTRNVARAYFVATYTG